MRRVVIVSYYYPPFPAVGGLRVGGMAKYLREHGWDVWVITPNLRVKPKDSGNVIQLSIGSTLMRVSSQSRKELDKTNPEVISRLKSVLPQPIPRSEILSSFVLDLMTLIDYINLRKEFLKAFDCLHKQYTIDAIISSSPPWSTHLIARDISRRYNIPWIVEYRDLWSLNPLPKWRSTKIGKLISQAVELKSTQYANGIVVINEVLKKKEQALIKDKPIVIIKNGFDPEETLGQIKKKKESNKFTITYTGSFYKSKRNPLPVVYAINELIKDKIIPRRQIQLNLFGPNLSEDILKKLQEFEFVNTGILSREEARRQQKNSDILLLLLAEEDYQSIPAKLFEYLSIGKPILAVGPTKNSMIEEILTKTGLGIFVISTDEDALKEVILSFYTHEIKIKPKKDVIMQYSQKEMAKKMSQVLNRMLKPVFSREGE